MNRNYSIERVEDAAWCLCREAGMKDIFTGKRPDSAKVSRECFAVVSVLTNMKDFEAYGKGVVRIAIYAKDLQGGVKNAPVLKEQGDRITSLLPYRTEDYLFDYSSESGFPDNSGYNIKAFNIYVMTLKWK